MPDKTESDALQEHFKDLARKLGKPSLAPGEHELDNGSTGVCVPDCLACEIAAEMEPDHGIDCRDFGVEDGCPVCDPEEAAK